MDFKRIWDDSCPREYDHWEQDGTTYVIQDLPPEDDEEALQILLKDLAPDEVLCKSCDLSNDPESVRGVSDVWMTTLKLRMSLACYAEKDGLRRLVALNVCLPKYKEEKELKIVGKKWRNVYDAIVYAESKAKSMEALGLDVILTALGLVVIRDCRGAKLGSKVLAAREPMCRLFGIKGTTTVFTSIAAQKLAARVGFKCIAEIPIKELAETGLDYPHDDERLVKVMIRRYD